MISLRRQSGLTLVELMIASAVGLIMLAGVGQLFLSTRQMNIADTANSDVQDTGRHILHFLSEQIRLAGMMGCAKLGANNYTSSITDYDDYYHAFNIGIEGYQPGLSSNIPDVINDLSIAAGTDVLVIRRASVQDFRMVQAQDKDSFYVEYESKVSHGCSGTNTDRINGICQGDILVAVDCQKARSFVASSLDTTEINGNTVAVINHGTGNTPSEWGGTASDNPMDKFDVRDTTISAAATTAYYVDDTDTLYSKVNNDSSGVQRLASGIEYMRILYGIDTDNDGSVNRYVSASTLSNNPQIPNNFNQVISLEIAILVRSQQPVLDASEVSNNSTNTYDLLGTQVTLDADKYLHRVFTTTVNLRNGGEG